MSKSFVKLDVEGAVGTLTFYTPEHNALPIAILTDLEQQIIKADAHADLKVLVIKSGGDRTSLLLLRMKLKVKVFLWVLLK